MVSRIPGLVLLVSSLGWALTTQAQIAQLDFYRSAPDLLAHDINGVTLGMTMAQVSAVLGMPIIRHPNNQNVSIATKGLDRYGMLFSAAGRLYEVQLEEQLGNFVVDRNYFEAIVAKLTAKYGPYKGKSDEAVTWEIYAGQRRENGTIEEARADVGGSPATLRLSLADYRVQSGDAKAINDEAERKAADAAHF